MVTSAVSMVTTVGPPVLTKNAKKWRSVNLVGYDMDHGCAEETVSTGYKHEGIQIDPCEEDTLPEDSDIKVTPQATTLTLLQSVSSRLRALRIVYNECARAIEIHCHQLTYWADHIVPQMGVKDLSAETSLSREALKSAGSQRTRTLLSQLHTLKTQLTEYIDTLSTHKRTFDQLYYARQSATEDDDKYEELWQHLSGVRGVVFVPCDSLLWQPTDGSLGSLSEFEMTVYEGASAPVSIIDCSPNKVSIKSPVSVLRAIFKSPLSVLSKASGGATGSKKRGSTRFLVKSKSVPRLHNL